MEGVYLPVGVAYTVEVSNAGPANASGVVLTDVVVDNSGAAAGPPPLNITPIQGAHINWATPSQGTCVIENSPHGFGGTKLGRGYPNKVTCDLGALASGSTANVAIEVRPNLNTFVVNQDEGLIADTASVSSAPTASSDVNPANDSDTVTASTIRS